MALQDLENRPGQEGGQRRHRKNKSPAFKKRDAQKKQKPPSQLEKPEGIKKRFIPLSFGFDDGVGNLGKELADGDEKDSEHFLFLFFEKFAHGRLVLFHLRYERLGVGEFLVVAVFFEDLDGDLFPVQISSKVH